MTEILINEYLYPAAIAALVALGTWLVKAATTWINTHVHNTYLNGVLTRMLKYSELATSTALRELGPDIRDALADGKLSAEERQHLQERAYTVMRQLWGNVDRKKLEKAFGKDELELMLAAAVDNALERIERMLPAGK